MGGQSMGRGAALAARHAVARLLAAIAPRRGRDDSFRLLFTCHPQPMWVYDLETLRFLEVNDAALARYGYTRSQFLAMGLADIRSHEDVALLEQLVSVPREPLECHAPVRHRSATGQVL